MVPAQTRVIATVAGSFDVLKAPESLTNFVRAQLTGTGQVIDVTVSTALFSDQYTARVEVITATDTDSVDTLRARIAAIFTAWNGLPVAVAVTSPRTADQVPAPPRSPFLPDLTGLTPLLWAGAALLVAVYVLPLLPKGRR